MAFKNINSNDFHVEFKDNTVTLYTYSDKPRVINMMIDDWKTLFKDSEQESNLLNSPPQSKEGNDKNKKDNLLDNNIFYIIEKLITREIVDEKKFIEESIIPSLKTS